MNTQAATLRGALASYITERELAIWRYVAQGHQNRGMACLMGISQKTVENHRQSLSLKINAHSPAEVTRLAFEYGVVPLTVRPLLAIVTPRGRQRYFLPPQTQTK